MMGTEADLARQITEERKAIRTRLRRMTRRTTDGFWECHKSSDGSPEDHVEQAQHELLEDEETRTYAVLTARAKALDRALESLRRGIYGICQTCGTRIPRSRLEAMPGVALCISCQEQAEQAA